MNKLRVSVILLVSNEEAVIEKTIRDYYNELLGKIDFEMIVMEDGSVDRTKEILRELNKELGIRIFLKDERRGYLGAIIEGLKYARYDWIFLVDSDYQFLPEDFWKLTPYIDKCDVIVGRKAVRQDAWYRVFLGWGYNTLCRIVFPKLRRFQLRDIDTGFRLFKKQVALHLAPDVQILAFFTAEFIIRAVYAGYQVLEVPVRHLRRALGKSRANPVLKIPSVVLHELLGIAKLRFNLHASKK